MPSPERKLSVPCTYPLSVARISAPSSRSTSVRTANSSVPAYLKPTMTTSPGDSVQRNSVGVALGEALSRGTVEADGAPLKTVGPPLASAVGRLDGISERVSLGAMVVSAVLGAAEGAAVVSAVVGAVDGASDSTSSTTKAPPKIGSRGRPSDTSQLLSSLIRPWRPALVPSVGPVYVRSLPVAVNSRLKTAKALGRLDSLEEFASSSSSFQLLSFETPYTKFTTPLHS
eukprot:scaffold7068_cov301-Pinguiococcus_pyrenoidosus.AAC.21